MLDERKPGGVMEACLANQNHHCSLRHKYDDDFQHLDSSLYKRDKVCLGGPMPHTRKCPS